MNEIVLSHKDTASFEEIALEKEAAGRVYEKATTHYHNILLSIFKSKKELWKHIKEAYDLDQDKNYGASYDVKRRRFVVQVKHEE